MRLLAGVSIAFLTIAAMPTGRGAVVPDDLKSDPARRAEADQSAHPVVNCLIDAQRCIDLFKKPIAPCDAKRHPCEPPKPMPVRPEQRNASEPPLP